MIVKNTVSNESLFVIAKRANGEVSYQVLDEETWTPYWQQAKDITVVDSSTPDRWITTDIGSGTLTTFPEFSTSGFWETYFDSDPRSVQLYEGVVVPPVRVEINIDHMLASQNPTWSNLKWLLGQKFCPPLTAIELATRQLSEGSNDSSIIELAGLLPSESESIEQLVNRLAESDPIDKKGLVDIGSKWLQDCCPEAYSDVFIKRWEEVIKTGNRD